jgi:glyoxylase-like metal-dependent hydrolase (beta-lactamase superfamily II)
VGNRTPGFGSVRKPPARERAVRGHVGLALLSVLLGAFIPARAEPGQPRSGGEASSLRLDVFTGSERAYLVTSTLIYGKAESILVDAQFHQSDAAQLADWIVATHTTLLAILITHPDLDHYLGLEILHRRFPEARLYMAPQALAVFKRTMNESLAYARNKIGEEAPQHVPTPEELPSSRLNVDGEPVLILADRQGDVGAEPSNSILVVPSLGAVILGDLAFHGVHPWLEGSEQPQFLERAARSAFATPPSNASLGDGIDIAEARKAIEDGNLAWGRARVAIDVEAFDKALSRDFYVKLPDRRLTRQEFIERIIHYPYGRVTRFDPTVLTVEREGDAWVAIIMERLEYDQPGREGKATRGYTLAVTRDGWKRVGADWKVLFSELISAETWRDGSRPPMGFW